MRIENDLYCTISDSFESLEEIGQWLSEWAAQNKSASIWNVVVEHDVDGWFVSIYYGSN